MTPAALVDLYSGEIVTGSEDHRALAADLAAMALPELRQVERLAPRYSRLARMAAVELDRRVDARAMHRRAREAAAMVAAVTMPRTTRREEW